MTEFHQLPCVFLMDFTALTLPVGTDGTTYIWSFIIIDPQPMQTVDQLLFSMRIVAFLIGILYSQNETATSTPCKQEWI
jgi:hypothetical protein